MLLVFTVQEEEAAPEVFQQEYGVAPAVPAVESWDAPADGVAAGQWDPTAAAGEYGIFYREQTPKHPELHTFRKNTCDNLTLSQL